MTSVDWGRSWDGRESALVNGLVVALVVGCAFSFTRPLGGSGLGLAVLILLLVNSAAAAIRLVPQTRLGERGAAVALTVATVAAALLQMVSLTGFAFGFAGMATGHAGFRLRPRWALSLGGAAGVLFAVALAFAPHFNVGLTWPWYFGLLAGSPVLAGLYNRSRSLSLRNGKVAAEQAIRAAESEARESALTERTRIARDIHDVLAHSLSGVTMQLELADALLDAGAADKAHDVVRRAQRMTKDGLAEARRAVQALREDALPLPQALAALTAGEAELRCLGEPVSLDTTVSQVFLRAAQESLTNARKHAPGAAIDVELGYLDDRTTLVVTNGPGTTEHPLRDAGSGLGLVGMRERAALVGGTVEAGPVSPIEPGRGELVGGWRVRVEVPR